jgi:hypothetical protein
VKVVHLGLLWIIFFSICVFHIILFIFFPIHHLIVWLIIRWKVVVIWSLVVIYKLLKCSSAFRPSATTFQFRILSFCLRRALNWNLGLLAFLRQRRLILHFFVLLLLLVGTVCLCVTLPLFLLFLCSLLLSFFRLLFCLLNCLNVFFNEVKYFLSVSNYADRPVICIADWHNDPGFIKDILFPSPCLHSLILDGLSAITHIKTEAAVDIRLSWVANQFAVELRVINVDALRFKHFLWVG